MRLNDISLLLICDMREDQAVSQSGEEEKEKDTNKEDTDTRSGGDIIPVQELA